MSDKISVPLDIKYIQSLDTSDIAEIIFTENTGKIHHINDKSIKKIALFIEEYYEKNIFEPLELKEAGEYLIKNYQSNLPENEYKKLIQILGDWVENGGKFQIIGKIEEHQISTIIGRIFIYLYSMILIIIGVFFIACGGYISLNTKNETFIKIGGISLIINIIFLIKSKGYAVYFFILLSVLIIFLTYKKVNIFHIFSFN